MNKLKLTYAIALAAVSLAACATPVDHTAHYQEAITARQNAMKAIGAASAQLRSPTLDAAGARAAGRTINDNLKVFAANLPQGSGGDSGIPTKARNEIWTSSAAFNTALERGLSASAALAATSGEAATIRTQASAVMQSCAGCHTAYRL